MSKFKDLCKKLPSMEFEFEVEIKGDYTGIPFQGFFKSKIPNLQERVQIDKVAALLSSGFELPTSTENLNYMLSYLKHAVKESPEWWESSDFGAELYDYNVISGIYSKVIEFENQWNEKVWGKEESKDEPKEEKLA